MLSFGFAGALSLFVAGVRAFEEETEAFNNWDVAAWVVAFGNLRAGAFGAVHELALPDLVPKGVTGLAAMELPGAFGAEHELALPDLVPEGVTGRAAMELPAEERGFCFDNASLGVPSCRDGLTEHTWQSRVPVDVENCRPIMLLQEAQTAHAEWYEPREHFIMAPVMPWPQATHFAPNLTP